MDTPDEKGRNRKAGSLFHAKYDGAHAERAHVERSVAPSSSPAARLFRLFLSGADGRQTAMGRVAFWTKAGRRGEYDHP